LIDLSPSNLIIFFNPLLTTILSFFTSLDVLILRAINSYGGRFLLLDNFMIFLGIIGEAYCWFLFSIPMLLSKRYRKIGIKWIILLGLTGLLTFGLKILVARPRPYLTYEWVKVFGEQWRYSPYSFPSGHAMRCWATNLMLWKSIKYKKERSKVGALIGLIVIAFLISISRVYLGVHYPSDVLIGSLIGIGIGFLTKKDLKMRKRNKSIGQKKKIKIENLMKSIADLELKQTFN
jgi:undecaprenyl-diphosphatase